MTPEQGIIFKQDCAKVQEYYKQRRAGMEKLGDADISTPEARANVAQQIVSGALTVEGKVPVDRLVKIYVKMRDARSALKKEFEAADEKIELQMKQVGVELKARAQAEGVDGFKTEFGTMYMQETLKTSCADWGIFGEFLKDHDPLTFLEKRVSSTAIKEYMKEHEGELPPGINIFKEIEARVRRGNEK